MAAVVAHVLADHRRRLRRFGPHDTARAITAGAVLVDIRPEAQRREHGEVPGALLIERNVLEWRCDPTSPDRLPAFEEAADTVVIIMCQEGYASSLAATSLQDLGLARATDLDGGFRAWADAGLPTIRP